MAGEGTELVQPLLELAQRIRCLLSARLAELGLSEARYQALTAIEECGAEGCTQRQLADRLALAESSVSALVERMRTDGLLYRIRSRSDRRKRILALTPQARALLTSVRPHVARCANELTRGLNLRTRQSLAEGLRAWSRFLEDAGPSSHCRPTQAVPTHGGHGSAPPPHVGKPLGGECNSTAEEGLPAANATADGDGAVAFPRPDG